MKKLSNNEINARLAIIGFILTLIILIASTAKSNAKLNSAAEITKSQNPEGFKQLVESAPSWIKDQPAVHQSYINKNADAYMAIASNLLQIEAIDLLNAIYESYEDWNNSYNTAILEVVERVANRDGLTGAKACLMYSRVYWPDVITNYNKKQPSYNKITY